MKILHNLPIRAKNLQKELDAKAVLITTEYEDYTDWGASGNSISLLYLALKTLSQVAKNEDDFLRSGYVSPELVNKIDELVEQTDKRLIEKNSFRFFRIKEPKIINRGKS